MVAKRKLIKISMVFERDIHTILRQSLKKESKAGDGDTHIENSYRKHSLLTDESPPCPRSSSI